MIKLPINDKYALRSFRASDKETLVGLANNAKVSINLRDGFPYPYTMSDADSWFESALNQSPETIFAIAESDHLIGGTGFHPLDDVYRYSAEIGYWLGEPYWGKGIATGAVRTLVDYAFSATELIKLFAGVFSNNQASASVLKKNGFTLEGTLRNSVVKRGKVLNELRYGLLREEWEIRYNDLVGS